jgi:hypothetical protein
MALQARRSRRRHGGVARTFAMHRERPTIERVGDADRRERAVIRAPTALEVVQADRGGDPSP